MTKTSSDMYIKQATLKPHALSDERHTSAATPRRLALLCRSIAFNCIISAVLAVCHADAGTITSVTVNRGEHNEISSYTVGIDMAPTETNTLYFAYGTDDGGTTTDSWEQVVRVKAVFPDTTSIDFTAPRGMGTVYTYSRFFLADELVAPYDTLYESMKTKNKHIDTGFYPNQDTRVVADFVGIGGYWFGCWSAAYNNRAFAFRPNNGNTCYRGYDGQGGDKAFSIPMQDDIIYHVDFNKNHYLITRASDGMTVLEDNFNYKSFTTVHSLYINAFNQSGTLCNGTSTLKSFKVYDNGILVRDYLPCSTNGVPLMWDKINDVLYPYLPLNSGSATPGAEVAAADDPFTHTVIPVNWAETMNIADWTIDVTVVPAGSCTLSGVIPQIVTDGGTMSAITETPSGTIEFLGWFNAGDAADATPISTNPTLQLSNITGNRSIEARFAKKKVYYNFFLGNFGTFDANGRNTITVQYVTGDIPSFPAWTPSNNWQFDGWDTAMPSVVAPGTMNFTAFGREKAHRIVRYDSAAPAGGDGASWETAMNTMSEALAAAAVWTGEVWIKEGTHTIDATIEMPSNVVVRGGFDGGFYANDDAERAERNPPGHPSVLTAPSGRHLLTLNAGTCNLSTSMFEGITFKGAGAGIVYSDNNGISGNSCVFSNCVFTGGSIRLQKKHAAFYDCIFTNMTAASNYGNIFYEAATADIPFIRCVFKDTAVGPYGFINNNHGGVGIYRDCLFENLNANAGHYERRYTATVAGANAGSMSNCIIRSCSSVDAGGICANVNMRDCRFEGNYVKYTGAANTRDTLLMPLFNETRQISCTFFNNEIEIERPSVTEGYVYGSLASIYMRGAFINCTFDRNIVRVTTGEGATAVRSTLRSTSNGSYGLAANCTFVDNGVDCDIVTANLTGHSLSDGYDFTLVNSILYNTINPDYTPVMTLTGDAGFYLLDCILWKYRTIGQYAPVVTQSAGIRTKNPELARDRDDGNHRYYCFNANSPYAKDFGRDIVVCESGVRYRNAADTAWLFRSNCNNAGGEVGLLPDMRSTVRETGAFRIGTVQETLPIGTMIIMR